jgi:hypothetical protein
VSNRDTISPAAGWYGYITSFDRDTKIHFDIAQLAVLFYESATDLERPLPQQLNRMLIEARKTEAQPQPSRGAAPVPHTAPHKPTADPLALSHPGRSAEHGAAGEPTSPLAQDVTGLHA